MKLCVSYGNSLKLCVSLSLSFSTSLFNIKTRIVLDRSTHGDQSYLDPSINLFKFFNYSFIVTLNYWTGNKKKPALQLLEIHPQLNIPVASPHFVDFDLINYLTFKFFSTALSQVPSENNLWIRLKFLK